MLHPLPPHLKATHQCIYVTWRKVLIRQHHQLQVLQPGAQSRKEAPRFEAGSSQASPHIMSLTQALKVPLASGPRVSFFLELSELIEAGPQTQERPVAGLAHLLTIHVPWSVHVWLDPHTIMCQASPQHRNRLQQTLTLAPKTSLEPQKAGWLLSPNSNLEATCSGEFHASNSRANLVLNQSFQPKESEPPHKAGS